MRSIFFSLIFVSLTSQASPLSGKWILQSKEIKATSGDCVSSLALKADSDSLKIRLFIPRQDDVKQKYSNFGRDGRVSGGCGSGTSMFTFESWSSCNWSMGRADSFENGNRILNTNYKCLDKMCTKREMNSRHQYAIQPDQSLLYTDRYLQGTEMQKINCRYVRQ